MEENKKLYSHEDVIKNLTTEFEGDELAAQVIASKYLMKEGVMYLEDSYADVCGRLASELARIELKYPKPIPEEEIYDLLYSKRLIPGGSLLFGIGNNKELTSLSNCFVIEPPQDSYGGILKAREEMVQLMKRRGGVGVDLSHLRGKGSPVKNAALTSTGAVSFMEGFSHATEEVAQGGRRGALMLSMDVNHPDIEDFITAKQDKNAINFANISVKVDDRFMTKAANDLQSEERRLLQKIADNAYEHADPGLLFWDNILEGSPADSLEVEEFKTVSTNPCGEVPLNPYDSCRLMHINLNMYGHNGEVEWMRLREDVGKAARLMDDVIDLELEKIDIILNKIMNEDKEESSTKRVELELWKNVKRVAAAGRRTGLGLTGLADLFASLGFIYGYGKSIETTKEIIKVVSSEAYYTSIDMADERGYCELLKNTLARLKVSKNKTVLKILNDDVSTLMQSGKRNTAQLTLAPVGTGSIITQTTSGIEPLFAPIMKRKRREGDGWLEYTVIHKPLLKLAKKKNKIQLNGESDIEYANRLAALYYPKSTAHDVDIESKMELQAVLQEYIDHSISVTHNIPKEYPKEKVIDLIIKAWRLGLKGFTMYRDGTKDGVLKTMNDTSVVGKRPEKVPCELHMEKIEGESWLVIVGLVEGKLYELFALKAKKVIPKKVTNAFLHKVVDSKGTRYNLISDAVDIMDLVSHYETGNEQVLTRTLSRHLRNNTTVDILLSDFEKVSTIIGTFEQVLMRVLYKYSTPKEDGNCPEEGCEGTLIKAEGCTKCDTCSYNKCG